MDAFRIACIPFVVALTCFVQSAEAQNPKPAFEVVSIRRSVAPGPAIGVMRGDTYYGTAQTVQQVIQFAYDLSEHQLVGGPDWLRSDRFDIAAKVALDGATLTNAQQRLMLQELLASRFGLILGKEQREADVYALKLARADGRLGPDMHHAENDCVTWRKDDYLAYMKAVQRATPRPSSGAPMSHSSVCATVDGVAEYLSKALQTTVTNQTGLTGRWNYVIAHRSEAMLLPEDDRPGVFDAVQEQLGLRLEKQRGFKEVWAINSVHVPTPN